MMLDVGRKKKARLLVGGASRRVSPGPNSAQMAEAMSEFRGYGWIIPALHVGVACASAFRDGVSESTWYRNAYVYFTCRDFTLAFRDTSLL